MWHTDTREALGSLLQIQFSSPESTREICISEIFGRIDLFEKKYSRFCSGNTLESINSCIGSWQEIDPETRLLLSRLDALLGKRDLGFSLAVKKNLESLGYDRHYSFLPQSEVTRISPGGFTLRGGELLIDAPVEFGGFGKWQALDIAVEVLQKYEIKNFLCNFGGDIAAFGVNPEWNTWTIGLEHPLDATQAIGTIEISGGFLAVSGPSKRRWGKDGEFHHLINPVTGLPSEEWMGTYVVGQSGFETDIFATAIFCTPESWVTDSPTLKNQQFLAVRSDGSLYNQEFPGRLFS